MKWILNKSWFFLIEFICISLAVVLWSLSSGFTWQPLIIAIAPILVEISAGKSPLVRTPFNLPIAIFLLTAVVGVWAAYQPEAAWTKFWLLLTSILFYYLLSRQSVDNLWIVAGIVCLLGFGAGIFFFLSNDWGLQPQKFQFLSQIGIAWMRIRPNLGLKTPNELTGIVVLAMPFSIALTLECWRKKTYFMTLLFGLMAVLILVTILVSASRGAWMALGATAGLWIVWEMTGRLTKRFPDSCRSLFVFSSGLIACLAVGYIWTSVHGRLNQIAIGEANASITDQRFHLFWSAIELIKDVPFTGNGLNGFPGLYSSYIAINPNYIKGSSHNLFLDASLEQGILGGLMLLWIYCGSIFWLATRPFPTAHPTLRKAILASLLIITFHSLVDDIVYLTMYIPLLFFMPGMAVGLKFSTCPDPGVIRWQRSRLQRLAVPMLLTFGLLLIGLMIFRKPLLSALYTDLASVGMAKIELSNFPTGFWDDGQQANLLSPVEVLFNKAVTYEPANPHAHYRLGLIAMLKRDFPTAVDQLEVAILSDPDHRGIIKALGYAYLWNGEYAAAHSLLSRIPESNQEIGIYTWWWSDQNRPDLAANAEQYLEQGGSEQ
jgi:O-antigen ligase